MTPDELRFIRVNRGYARRVLAREINVPEQSLRRIEKGQGVSLLYAKRIADWYGVQVTDLMPEAAAA